MPCADTFDVGAPWFPAPWRGQRSFDPSSMEVPLRWLQVDVCSPELI